MRPVIIVFARAPVAGRVKTRLVPPLSSEQAASLHTCFVADTLERLSGRCIELHTDIETDAWREFDVARKLQSEGDLGSRMLAALDGGNRMILGSDSPDLPCDHLDELLRSSADVALGPTDDGGYYAIHCRRIHPQMFASVEWSTPQTLRQTVDACNAAGLSVALGSAWYDIDDAAGLRRLTAAPSVPPRTRKWLDAFSEV